MTSSSIWIKLSLQNIMALFHSLFFFTSFSTIKMKIHMKPLHALAVCWVSLSAPHHNTDSSGEITGSPRRWNGLSEALDFHYSARMWSLSITPTLTCWWINWPVWQGQLLPHVVLTAGFDIRNLSTFPFTWAAGAVEWIRWGQCKISPPGQSQHLMIT